MKKLILMIMTVVITFTMTGCNIIYEVPVNLMKTPKLNDNYIKNQKYLTDNELRVLIQSFMPEGYKILEDNKSMDKQSIYNLDVDGDGKDEYVVLVRNSNKTNIGFFVLKSKYGKWGKVFEWLDEGLGIKTVKIVSGLNNEGVMLLIGNMINTKGSSEYYLFNFKENWEGDNVDLGTWSELSIVDSKDGSINFLAENRDESKILELHSIRYDGEKFSCNYSTDIYQNKMNEYKSMIEEDEGNESAWYYYIYTKLMSGNYEDALEELNEYLDRDKGSDSIKLSEVKFEVLKALILSKLNRSRDAQEIIDKYEPLFVNPETLISNDLNAYEFYYTAGFINKRLKNKKKANYYFNNAINRLEKTYDRRITGYQEILSEVIENLINDLSK